MHIPPAPAIHTRALPTQPVCRQVLDTADPIRKLMTCPGANDVAEV